MKRISKVKFAFACALICLCCFFCMHACVSCVGKASQQERELEQLRAMREAYDCILHRIWIDMPCYTEDVLWETEEFLTLDSLIDGDFEDTFYFWSEQDSLDYEQSWNDFPNKDAIMRKAIR